MKDQKESSAYHDFISNIWSSMKKVLGIMTIRTIFERVLFELCDDYHFAEKLKITEEGLDTSKLPEAEVTNQNLMTFYKAFIRRTLDMIALLTGNALVNNFSGDLEEIE